MYKTTTSLHNCDSAGYPVLQETASSYLLTDYLVTE